MNTACHTLTDYLDSHSLNAGVELPSALQAHVLGCAQCQRQVYEQQKYVEVLKRYQPPTLSQSAAAHLLERAAVQARVPDKSQVERLAPRLGLAHWFYGGVVASCMAVVLVVLLRDPSNEKRRAPELSQTQSSPSVLQIPANTALSITRDVTVVIEVPSDMNNAELALSLPTDYAVEGLEGLQQVQWAVNLKQGQNILTLPITFKNAEQAREAFTLAASIQYEAQIRHFDLVVNAPAEQSGLPLQDASDVVAVARRNWRDDLLRWRREFKLC